MFRVTETLIVKDQDKEMAMSAVELYDLFNENIRKKINIQKYPNAIYSKTYLDFGIKGLGVHAFGKNDMFDTIKSVKKFNLLPSNLITIKQKKTNNVNNLILPSRILVLNDSFVPVSPRVGDILFDGYQIMDIQQQGKFDFIEVKLNIIKNVKKLNILISE